MKKIFLCLMLCLLLLPAPAWGEGGERVIVCSFYPIRVFAENLLRDVPDVRLETLAPAGTGCLHDFQLLTGDLRSLDGASALLINGAGMEDSILPLITREMRDLPVLDASQDIALLEENGAYNPHIWLSVGNAIQMVGNLSEGLQALLPDDAERIAQNAEDYQMRLQALRAELIAGLSDIDRRDIVTFHEAFPYLAEELALRVVASVTVEPDEAPSPRMIAQVIEAIRAAGGCPLFNEPGIDSDALRTIAAETGSPVYVLDPVTDGEPALDSYETKMRSNLRILKEALTDSPQ